METVRDEDYRYALLRELAQGCEEDLGLGFGEHGRGLVEDEDPGLAARDLPRDLGELLVPDRHLGDEHVGVEPDAELVDGRLGALLHGSPVEDAHPVAEDVVEGARPHGLAIEHDVLGGREAGNQAEFLVHHADARVESVEGAAEVDLLAVDADAALVAPRLGDDRHPEEDPHQGGFTGAVFPHEAQDLSRLELEADVVEHDVAIEFLRDVLDRENRT